MSWPVTASEFQKYLGVFDPFEENPTVAVAVSGGADSLALTLLTHRWVQDRGGTCVALTVDHGLRPDSLSEAEAVGRLLKSWGVCHHVLSWAGEKPGRRLQEKAREARYFLLTDWCRAHDVLHLLVGHHLDDQHETRLIRLAQKTGIEGLAGMSRIREFSGVRLLRPFLDIPKARLVALLQKESVTWIEDPSNKNPTFTRVRVRQGLAESEESILRASQVGHTRQALEHWCHGFLSQHSQIFPEGFGALDLKRLAEIPDTFQEVVLSCILRTVGPFLYAPRKARLLKLIEALKSHPFRGRTCHGCLLKVKENRLYVYRESLKIEDVQIINESDQGEKLIWDHRFTIKVPQGLSPKSFPFHLRALGQEGWSFLKDEFPETRSFYPFHSMVFGMPSLWKEGELLWTPMFERLPVDPCVKDNWRNKVVFTPRYPLAKPTFLP